MGIVTVKPARFWAAAPAGSPAKLTTPTVVVLPASCCMLLCRVGLATLFMHPVVLLPAIAANSAWASAAEGYTETLSSTASTLSALLKSGLWTFVGAILATRVGMPTHEASWGDHGVTRVGAAAAPPADHPEGRSDSCRSAAVPWAAVCGLTAGALAEDDVADRDDDPDPDVDVADVARSCPVWP